MAEESTTGSALYSVGTGVIGDFSAEARKNAMDRMKVEGVERKRKQQETEKKSEDAFSRLNELKTGGARAYSEYLKEKRDGISNWLTDGFGKTDGKFFSGPEGRKNRIEFNNKIAEFNNSVAYTTQTQADLEKQQALLAQAPESYTEDSVEANKNYMSLKLEDRITAEVPKLILKVDPIDWEKNLVYDLPDDMFTEKDPHSSGSNSYILNEEKLNTYVDNTLSVAFSGIEGVGTPSTEGFAKQMKIRFDADPLSRTMDRVTVVDEATGDTAYILALKNYAKDKLSETIKLTQSSGKISAATPAKVIEKPEAAPVKGAGGTQRFIGGLYNSDTQPPLAYEQSANIDFDSGDKALRALNADVVFTEDGNVETRNKNTILPKEGGIIEYGFKLTDFTIPQQKAMKKAGITGPTVDVLRITETTEKVDDGYGNVSGGVGKSTLIPITPQVRNSLMGASDKFKGLEQASAGELD